MYPEGTRILIVDSDAGRRRVIERVLADEGFGAVAVPEGFSAVRAAGSTRFALAVAALSLPGMLDGRAMLRQIRARQPWLKVLFTGDPGGRPAWVDRDRDDFIGVPFRRHELLGCVFELLQRRHSWGPAAAAIGAAAASRAERRPATSYPPPVARPLRNG